STLAVLASTAFAAETVSLSSLDISPMKQSWGEPQVNRSISGTSLTIAGKQFATGIGTHATSRLLIDLDGQAERFEATVGLDAAAGPAGSVTFGVYADQQKVYKAGPMRVDTTATQVSVPLAGVRQLLLKVTNAGDSNRNSHANWADARIITAGKGPEVIS